MKRLSFFRRQSTFITNVVKRYNKSLGSGMLNSSKYCTRINQNNEFVVDTENIYRILADANIDIYDHITFMNAKVTEIYENTFKNVETYKSKYVISRENDYFYKCVFDIEKRLKMWKTLSGADILEKSNDSLKTNHIEYVYSRIASGFPDTLFLHINNEP